MRCGIVCVDPEGRTALVNEHARRILGLAPVPAGMPVAEALHEHPRLAQVLLGSLHMTSPPNRAEIDLETGAPSEKVVGFTISPIQGQGGRPGGVAMFFKDLTQIEHAEERERLRERLAALGQMASSLAHEIRNPLASIEVSCHLLVRRLGSDGPARELLNKVLDEVKRVNATVTESLEFVRPVRPVLAPGRVDELLEQSVLAAQERLPRGGVAIERRLAPVPSFPLDRELLQQVFVNLILNAIEACADGGRVTVESGWAGAGQDGAGFAVVRVADTGPGVPAGDRDQVFFPFYTTKRNGSGVGLALARKIVTAHGGVIEVRDASGGGAEFVVRLPAPGTTVGA